MEKNNNQGDKSGAYGFFEVKKANDVMRDAVLLPTPESLLDDLWTEGEICLLYADTGAGKSIYAMQTARAVSTSRNVLYFDFELTEKQFQMRYTDVKTGELYHFPDTLYRVSLTPEELSVKDGEDAWLKGIEATALHYGAQVIIIDNISWLCAEAEDGELAAKLMRHLMHIKREYGFSILVLAHTPKRDQTRPITQNDLAGSKKLLNFADSAFAIGFSFWGEDYRYIKQIKSRHGLVKNGADNVITYKIEKPMCFLALQFEGFSTEAEHLKEKQKTQKNEGKETHNQIREDFKQILGDGLLSYNELKNKIISISKIGEEGAKKRIKKGVSDGYIDKDESGKYFFKKDD